MAKASLINMFFNIGVINVIMHLFFIVYFFVTLIPINNLAQSNTRQPFDYDAYRLQVQKEKQWKPAEQDQTFYQDDPIPGQISALNKDGHIIYPPSMDYMKKINDAIFKKYPNRREDFIKLIKYNACPGGDLQGLQLKGLWFYKQDPKTKKYIPADLRGANLSNANLDNARLAGADLRGAICNNTTFNYAALSGANFTGATFICDDAIDTSIDYTNVHANRFKRNHFSYTTAIRCIFDDTHFKNVSFSLANLAGASFKRANLESTAFIFFTDLSNATFNEAINFIEDRWQQPHIYLSPNTTIDTMRQQNPSYLRDKSSKTNGLGYIVIDNFVKFHNTTFPHGKKFPQQYHITPGLGTSDIYRNVKTVETK